MNDSKNSSNGLLVLRVPTYLSEEQAEDLTNQIAPLADRLGVEPLVLGAGFDARLEYGASALLERVCVALEEIAQQGRAPELSEPQIAPQALNARQPSEHEIVAALSKSYPPTSGLNHRG